MKEQPVCLGCSLRDSFQYWLLVRSPLPFWMGNPLMGFQLILRAERLAAYFTGVLGMHIALMFIQLFLTAEGCATGVTLVLILVHGIHSFRFFPFDLSFKYSFSPLFHINE